MNIILRKPLSEYQNNEKVVIYVALFVLISCSGLALLLPKSWQIVLDNLHWTATSAASAWLLWRGYLKANLQEKLTKYWFFIGAFCYFIGQLLWDVQTALEWKSFPAPSDMFYPMLGVGFIIGFLVNLKKHLSHAQYLASEIDLFALVASVLGLVLILYLPKTPNINYLQLLVLASYPVSLLSAACLCLLTIAYIRPKLNYVWWCLFIGLTIEGLIWMQWNLDSLNSKHASNALLNKLFSLCDLIIGSAALLWTATLSKDATFIAKCIKWQRKIPIAAFAITTLTVVLIWVSDRDEPFAYYVGLTSIILVMLLSISRQNILHKESEHLLQTQLQLIEKDKQYQYLKQFDPLTKLPNRLQYQAYIETSLLNSQQDNQALFLFYIDIDRFKLINDSLGHEVGDLLLMSVTERLTQHFPQAFIARLSGDKFLILIDQRHSSAEASTHAQAMIDAISPSHSLGGIELNIDVSIGISAYPNDSNSASELLRNADSAMFVAKRFGGSNYQFYTPELTHKAQLQLELDNSLRAAITNNHFYMDYQPIFYYDGSDILKIKGVEALIRWRNNDQIIQPLSFIKHAEATGFILQIGDWVVNETFRQLSEWNEKLPEPISLSINLSPRQFYDKNLVTKISAKINEYALNPACIKLEITESAMFDQEDLAMNILRQLKALGVMISLDDFGTGHSSLSQLRKIIYDEIKIDRSFLQNVPDNHFDSELLLNIINMTDRLDLEIVCEGIETHTQFEFLKNTNCKSYQGFLLARPQSAEKIITLVLKNSS